MINKLSNKHYHTDPNDQTPAGRGAHLFHNFKKLMTSEGFKGSIAKLVKSVFGMTDAIRGTKDLKEAQATVGFFSDVLKFLNLPKTLSELQENKGNPIKQASLSLKLADQSLTIFKILEFFKAIDMGIVASTMGKIPTVGAHLAKALPFGNILSIITVTQSSLDISLGVRKIRASKKVIGHCVTKQLFWSSVNPATAAATRIQTSQSKLSATQSKLHQAKQKENSAQADFDQKETKHTALTAKMQVSSGAKRALLKLSVALAKSRVKRAYKRYLQESKSIKTLKDRIATLEKRIAGWEKLRKGTPPEFKALKERKVEKWNIKQAIQKRTIRDEKIGITINALVIAISVAAIALTVLAFMSLPFTAIPMAILGITISGIGFSFAIWKQYRKKQHYNSVPLSSLYEPQA